MSFWFKGNLFNVIRPTCDGSIKDCINKYILPHQYEIFSMITKAIIDECLLDIFNQYLDGTKIEANTNKYQFVWKPLLFIRNLIRESKNYL